jgi:hypothetical protein
MSVEIPSNLGELSILEPLNNLCRELNFSCAGGRRVLTTRLQNERERPSTNTPQSNIQTVPVNNTLSISNARQSFSADQIGQLNYADCFAVDLVGVLRKPTRHNNRDSCRWTANYPANANATRKARTAWSIPIFKFQRAPAAADFIPWTCCLNPASRWGFTPEIPNIYVRDIESGEFFELAKLLPS